MEYSSDKVMTRKEYLKSKRKGKLGLRILKYTLLLTVIALLSVYLFKQLDVYNNVTKIANKVVEETALAKTLTMYYVADGYTKDSKSDVVIYKAYDESRTKIADTAGFSNINVVNGILYGLQDEALYAIELETNLKSKVIDGNIREYIVRGEKIYCYIESKSTKETGIYLYDIATKEMKLIINIVSEQMLVDDNYIFVISKGKTEKSIIRYNLNGSGRTIMTDKEIVTYFKQDKNVIYYVADEKLYSLTKTGRITNLIMEEDIYIDRDVVNFNAEPFAIKDDNVYYITKGEEKNLCIFNIKTGEKQVLSKKNVESMQLVSNTLYYKLNNGIGLYRINLESGKSEHVTNIRGIEYICIN